MYMNQSDLANRYTFIQKVAPWQKCLVYVKNVFFKNEASRNGRYDATRTN